MTHVDTLRMIPGHDPGACPKCGRWRKAGMTHECADLRSHEPPRNSGEGTAVNGPMPLAGGDDAIEPDE